MNKPIGTYILALSLVGINAEITRMLGNVPLKAYEDGGRIYLWDGINAPSDVEDQSLIGIAELLYDWAIFAGYTNEDLEDFLGMA